MKTLQLQKQIGLLDMFLYQLPKTCWNVKRPQANGVVAKMVHLWNCLILLTKCKLHICVINTKFGNEVWWCEGISVPMLAANSPVDKWQEGNWYKNNTRLSRQSTVSTITSSCHKPLLIVRRVRFSSTLSQFVLLFLVQGIIQWEMQGQI